MSSAFNATSNDLNGNHIFLSQQYGPQQFQTQQLSQKKSYPQPQLSSLQTSQQVTATPQQGLMQPQFSQHKMFQQTNRSNQALNGNLYSDAIDQIPDEQIVAGLQAKTDQLKQDGFNFDDLQESVTIENLLEDDPLLSFTTALDRQTSNDTILQSSSPIAPVEPLNYKHMGELTLNPTTALIPSSPPRYRPQMQINDNPRFMPTPAESTNIGSTPIAYQFQHSVVQPSSNNHINYSQITAPVSIPTSASLIAKPSASQFRAQVQSQTIFQQKNPAPDPNFPRPSIAFVPHQKIKSNKGNQSTLGKIKASKIPAQAQERLDNQLPEFENKPLDQVYPNQQLASTEHPFHGGSHPDFTTFEEYQIPWNETPSKQPVETSIETPLTSANIKKSSSTTKLNKVRKGSNIIFTKSKSFLVTPSINKNNAGLYSTLDFSKQANMAIGKDKSKVKPSTPQATILRVQPVKSFEFVFEQGIEKSAKNSKAPSRRTSAGGTPTSSRFPKLPKPPVIDGHGSSFYSPTSTSPTNSDLSGTSPLTGSFHHLQSSPITSSFNRFSPTDSSASINEIPSISRTKKKSVSSIYSETESPSAILRDMKAGMIEFKANPK